MLESDSKNIVFEELVFYIAEESQCQKDNNNKAVFVLAELAKSYCKRPEEIFNGDVGDAMRNRYEHGADSNDLYLAEAADT